jgi:hypothetical protein
MKLVAIVWILVMHLLMSDGSVVSVSEEVEAINIEACLDIGKGRLEELHKERPDSTSALHFCIKKEEG